MQWCGTESRSNLRPFRLDQIVIPRQRSSIYQIDAFNQRLDLRLIPSEDFLMSSIDGRKSQECFYRGYVNEDLSSMISINACYGLVSDQVVTSE